jgi:hypothetical protein
MTTQVETHSQLPELEVSDRPSGPGAAAFVSAGIGSLFMGIGVVLNEYSAQIKSLIGIDFNAFLKFDANYGLGSGVGPLSGKVIVAVLAYLISFAILFALWRNREISVRKAFIWTLVLTAIGFALTFPPIFMLFA